MSEFSAVMPLSGEEVVDAVLDKVRQALERDCFCSGTTAWEGFDGVVMIRLRLKDVGREESVEKTITVGKGVAEGGRVAEAVVEIQQEPPNKVRVDSGQKVPVVVDTGGKKEVKHIQYRRGSAE